uniref:RNA-directed DNA polymerase n=1 Tax=Photinus pyralis TaxID=7054 RepID=A0A1Y1JUB3_PHOPY
MAETKSWKNWLHTVNTFYKPFPKVCSNFVHNKHDSRPYISLSICGERIRALFDSGANQTILGSNGLYLIKKFNLILKRNGHEYYLSTADGKDQKVLGTVELPIIIDGVCKSINAIACSSILNPLILGMDACYAFGFKTDFSTDSFKVTNVSALRALHGIDDLDEQQKLELDTVIDNFKNISGPCLSRTNLVSHFIDVGDAQPIKQRFYPLSPAMQKHADAELDRMLKEGIVRPSKSPWSSPMVLVRKKGSNPEQYRLCFDGRKLNSVTKRDAYPLPYLNSILDGLRDARYLTSIDLKQAFYQIPLHPDSCEKTAFVVPRRGLYEYTVLPFGIANAPATQQRLMDTLFGPLLGEKIFCYLDDIIIISSTFGEHITLLKEVFLKLQEANLTINIEKCQFCRSSLNYLGYLVDKNGLHTDPSKVQAIREFPKPTTTKEIKRFLGMAGWYRRFVKDFSTISAPISDLIKGKFKGQKINWTTEADKSFNSLKTILCSAPILASPDFNKMFSLQCDASGYGVGCVLTQDDDRVIAYASRTLTNTERNYSVTERECLAVLFGIEKFRGYIEGTHFHVITDHYSLIWLMQMRNPSGRLARWSMRLSQYSFTVIHRKGKINIVPDALSRSPVEVCALKITPNDFDGFYQKMLNEIKKFPEKFPDWRCENELIFKYVPNQHNVVSNLTEWKQLVPKSKRNQLLNKMHDHPTSSHLGALKTYQKLSEQYYWPKMRADVSRYVRRCEICAANKSSQLSRPGLMGQEKKVCYPFQCLSVDIIGPLPRSLKGNTSIIVVADWFTKFVLLKPVRQAHAKAVVDFLENDVFLIFGVPQICMVDNGPQFISSQFKHLIKNYNIPQVWYNANYHPQVNFVERVNRVIGTAIRSYVTDNHRNWDLEIFKVAHAIRNSVHDVTGYSPSFLNFGRIVPISGDYYNKLEIMKEDDLKIGDRENLVNDIHNLSDIYKDVNQRLHRAYEKNTKFYNLRKRPLKFKVGDTVWKKNYTLSDASKYYSKKLAPKYQKCKVKKITGQLTYELISEEGKNLGVYHVKDLKPYYVEENE